MFESNGNDARKFLEEIAIELHHPQNLHSAQRIMTAVLHSIRDVLTVQESLHLIAQLPLYIKGIYVTGWHLGEKKRIRDRDDFIERLLFENERTGPHDFGNEAKAIERTRAVIRVLKRHVSKGEMRDIERQFPAGLKDLWMSDDLVHVHSEQDGIEK